MYASVIGVIVPGSTNRLVRGPRLAFAALATGRALLRRAAAASSSCFVCLRGRYPPRNAATTTAPKIAANRIILCDALGGDGGRVSCGGAGGVGGVAIAIAVRVKRKKPALLRPPLRSYDPGPPVVFCEA